MSNANIKVSNAANFRDRICSKRMPATDKILSTPLVADQYPVADQIIQDAWSFESPRSEPIWGGATTFIIPRSVGRIYELYLEIILPQTAGVTWTQYTAAKLVQQYTVNVGNQLIQTSGEAMFFARQKLLDRDGRGFFAEQSTPNTHGTSIFLVCDYPGAYSVSIPGSIDSHEASYSIPFALNRCNQDMQVTIQLAQLADMYSGATVPVGNPSMRLHYQVVWSSDDNSNLVANTASQIPLNYPGYYLSEYTAYNVPVGVNEVPVDLTPALQDGQILMMLARVTTASQASNKQWYLGSELKTIKLSVGSVDFYKTDTTGETFFRDGLLQRQAPFTDSLGNAFYYQIWGVTDPYLIASDEYLGVNLYRNNPRLYISAPTDLGLCSVQIIVMTKALYQINSSTTASYFITAEN